MRVDRHEISRIEGFSDAVFAFALTLLVVSLEVPHSYHELMALMQGFLPFACSFALLVWIWYEQTAFFRSYHLHDRTTVVLNAGLLFVVLFYVYPLKYVFNLAFAMVIPELRRQGAPSTTGEMVSLFVVYALGFIAVFVVFALMYWHAWRRRDALGMTPIEVRTALGEIGAHLTSAAVGAISLVWVIAMPDRLRPYAGFIYFLMGPAHWAYGRWNSTRLRSLQRAQVSHPSVQEGPPAIGRSS